MGLDSPWGLLNNARKSGSDVMETAAFAQGHGLPGYGAAFMNKC
jgi:hypothetical protein